MLDGSAPGNTPVRRVLQVSYACHPIEGSEPGVGWRMLRAALRNGDHVTLLTRCNNTAAIRDQLTPIEQGRCTIIGFDLNRVATTLKARIPFGVQIYYAVWQMAARRIVVDLNRHHSFDIAHHVTFAVDWLPAAASALAPEVPIVWGPIGGATTVPIGLHTELGLRGSTTEMIRVALGLLGRRVWGRHVAKISALTIAQNSDDFEAFKIPSRKIEIEPNAFIVADSIPSRPNNIESNVIVGLGRLMPAKGWSIAVKMMRHLPPELVLHLYGEGPDRRRLERLARRLEVSDRVHFFGAQPRRVAVAALASARCLVHPSLHDSAPGAVAEAVTAGCPVVCLDIGGTADMVKESGGTIVAARRRCERELAKAVTSPQLPSNTQRWSDARLDQLLVRWYGLATQDVSHGLD